MKSTLLKILSTAAFAMVVFPFLFVCDINAFRGISALRMLCCFGVGCIPFAAGYASSVISKKHKRLKIPMRIAGNLMFGLGFLYLPLGGDAFTVFALGSSCVFFFFIGERFGYKNFADMFPLSAFGFYIVLTLGCFIAVKVSSDESYVRAAADIVIGAFAGEFTAAALLTNQSGIFDRANMRKETRSTLPKGLSAYNAAMVLGMTVTGLVLCIFREQIAWVLSQIVLAAVKVMLYLASLFHAETMPLEQSEEGEIGNGMITSSPWGYLLEVLGAAVIVTLIVIFRRQIFAAIKSFFSRLGALFSGRPEESRRPEFTDVYEEHAHSRSKGDGADSIYAVRRAFRKETDTRRKYRLGYRVLLCRLKGADLRLAPSDTVSVQAERGSAYFGSAMCEIAEVYEGVRYGTSTPTEQQLSDLSGLVEK